MVSRLFSIEGRAGEVSAASGLAAGKTSGEETSTGQEPGRRLVADLRRRRSRDQGPADAFSRLEGVASLDEETASGRQIQVAEQRAKRARLPLPVYSLSAAASKNRRPVGGRLSGSEGVCVKIHAGVAFPPDGR